MEYVALVKDNKLQSQHVPHTADSTTSYGSTDIFHNVTVNLVIPQCTPTATVQTLSPRVMDQHDCLYMYLTPQTDKSDSPHIYILICFVPLSVPTTLAHSILQRLSHFSVNELTDNNSLKVAYDSVQEDLQDKFQKYKKNLVREQTNDDINEVVRLMNDNIDQFLLRQENISNLVDETRLLNDSGVKFQKNTVKINNKFWWDKYKSICLLISLIFVIILTIFMITYW